MLINLHVIPTTNANVDNVLTCDKGLSIKGQVRETSAPIPCRLRLFEKLSGRMVAEVITDQSGFYEFDHLAKTKFFIVAHHPTSEFNAVIQDNVVPK